MGKRNRKRQRRAECTETRLHAELDQQVAEEEETGCPRCRELQQECENARRDPELIASVTRSVRIVQLLDEIPAAERERLDEYAGRLGDLVLETVEHIGGWDIAEPLIDARLLELKRMPYRDYLRSVEWKMTRRFALRYADHRCQVCNNAGQLDVHHRTYERRGNEALTDLTVLCRRCHTNFHTGPGESASSRAGARGAQPALDLSKGADMA